MPRTLHGRAPLSCTSTTLRRTARLRGVGLALACFRSAQDLSLVCQKRRGQRLTLRLAVPDPCPARPARPRRGAPPPFCRKSPSLPLGSISGRRSSSASTLPASPWPARIETPSEHWWELDYRNSGGNADTDWDALVANVTQLPDWQEHGLIRLYRQATRFIGFPRNAAKTLSTASRRPVSSASAVTPPECGVITTFGS